jgi:hypothetical protein
VRVGAFTASVLVVVKGTPPAVTSAQLSHAGLPVPRELEELVQTLIYGFSDPDGDVQVLNASLAGPAGLISSQTETISPRQAEGSGSRQFSFDSSRSEGT